MQVHNSEELLAIEVSRSILRKEVPVATTTISVDEFQALEQRIMRTVELIRSEREARSSAETELAAMKELLDIASAENTALSADLAALKKERGQVKDRVDAMLKQLDDLV